MPWLSKMLCCLRNTQRDTQMAMVDREKKRIHKEIERDLKQDAKRRQREHRILLLGCGEAGKSTFIKQMRIIHSAGFSDAERIAIKPDIAANIVSAIQTLLENTTAAATTSLAAAPTAPPNSGPGAAPDEGPDEDEDDGGAGDGLVAEDDDGGPDDGPGPDGDEGSPEGGAALSAEDVRLLESLPPRPSPAELLVHADLIHRAWLSGPVQRAYRERNRFQLVECAKYFLGKVRDILRPDYVPTNQDIVQTRVRTTGIVEHDFEIVPPGEAKRKLVLIDVGGQRSERKKWIHCFSEVMLLIFLTAVSEYDQVLAEDESTNRMTESLRLFHAILDYHWFSTTDVILFLNKKDVLAEKLARPDASPVSEYFPDYTGRSDDYESVLEYFSERFESLNPNADERKIYVHATCATDTENIKLVYVVVQDVIMNNLLAEIMIN